MKERVNNWKTLLHKAIEHISRSGAPDIPWTLGGGTSLFLEFGHRYSQDIDIFLPNPQMLGFLSPRIADEIHEDRDFLQYGEQAEYIKLYFTCGQVDFIAAGNITSCPPSRKVFDDKMVTVDHPAEVVLKKLFYRGGSRKIRDVFDIAVVYNEYPVAMIQSTPVLGERLKDIKEKFAEMITDELWRENIEQEIQVFDKWRPIIPCVHDICALFFAHAERYCKTGEHRDEASLWEEVRKLINNSLPEISETTRYDGIT